jgi:catechol 2,3-dioxygenase-like lactoylglutathione lyase family enzyme
VAVRLVIAQLRTTDLAGSIAFYTQRLGLMLAFRHADFYAGIRAGDQLFHLKAVDAPDPSIGYVQAGEHFDLYLMVDDLAAMAETCHRNGIAFDREPHDTPWGTREFSLRDDQGHVLYFGQDHSA